MCKPHADRPAGSTFLKCYAVAVRVAGMNQPKPGHRQTALTDLTLHPQNPRHGDIGAIVESIEQNGWIGSLVAQCSTGHVLAGNHRMQAAAHCGFKKLPTHWIDCDDAAALRILLSDNRSSDLATNDDDILAELLTALVDTNDGLAGTGYDGDDLDLILADLDLPISATDHDELNETRTLEGLNDVSIDDPELIPEKGSTWRLGEHILVVADMMTGWSLWKDYLKGDRVFCPYPGPYLALAATEQGDSLLMVQPDRYMAGHVLSKWNAAHPEAGQV